MCFFTEVLETFHESMKSWVDSFVAPSRMQLFDRHPDVGAHSQVGMNTKATIDGFVLPERHVGQKLSIVFVVCKQTKHGFMCSEILCKHKHA